LFPLLLFFQILLCPTGGEKHTIPLLCSRFFVRTTKEKNFDFTFVRFLSEFALTRGFTKPKAVSIEFRHLGERRVPYRQRAVGPKFEKKKKTQHNISMNALNFVCLIFSYTSRICFPLFFFILYGWVNYKKGGVYIQLGRFYVFSPLSASEDEVIWKKVCSHSHFKQ
jgi:hypothetical protein